VKHFFSLLFLIGLCFADGVVSDPYRRLFVNAPIVDVVSCRDDAAIGPLTGVYRQERTGGKICILDYGETVLIPTTHSYGSPTGERVTGYLYFPIVFTSRMTRYLPEQPEIGGDIYVTGGDCPLEANTKLLRIAENKLLWTKPVFVYNDSCCNVVHIRSETDILIKIPPPNKKWRCVFKDSEGAEVHGETGEGHVAESVIFRAAYYKAWAECMSSHKKCTGNCAQVPIR